jgi:hypothetical protein
MKATLARTSRIVLAAITVGCCASAFAGMETMDLDTRFMAKLAKEKVRISAAERKEQEQQGQSSSQQNSSCGSQNIGNINTGGRIGATPQEVFVFAPNAINLVGNGGCR